MPPAEIIDLTISPRPEIIEIFSEPEDTLVHHNRTRENKKRKRKKRKTSNDLSSDGNGGSTDPSKAHSPGTGDKCSEPNGLEPYASTPRQVAPSAIDEPALFFFDDAAAPVAADGTPSPLEVKESDGDENQLLLPSHVTIFRDNGPASVQVIPPPEPGSDDEEYIEYFDYEDRKAPGLVRYFEVEGEESNHSKPSVFKCKKCGAEGDHRTYECPVQICLTCGVRDEHSTRSCPITKTCYTCGMKGHINKTCPNRFSASLSSNLHGDCDRCGPAEHNMNECPTLWRIYQYVNDEERVLIRRCREQKRRLAIGEGGEGYIGEEMWCYNCANMGHLGDDCDDLPHPATFPTECSAFSSYNIMSGPFYDPATEPVCVKREPGRVDRARLPDEWNVGAPADVGRRGKNKDREKLEKKFRELEDECEDWFNDIGSVKKRGKDQQASPPALRGRRIKFGSFRDGGHELSSSLPTMPGSSGGSSLLSRLGDAPGGRSRGKVDCGQGRHEPPRQSGSSIRIRGAAAEQKLCQEGRYAGSHKTDWVRGQESEDRWNRDKRGGSRRGHGPRYKGGYER